WVAVLLLAIFSADGLDSRGSETAESGRKKVYVLPIRENIAPPLVFLVRRGVKEAMEAKADLLVLDMETNGGRVGVTEEIIEILNEKGQILTLTNTEAERPYGDPPKPLLSSGTVGSIEELLQKLDYANASRVDIRPSGAEKLAMWLNLISPLLLIIGIAGIYI